MNPAILELENSLRQVAVVVSDLDAMKTFGLNLVHFIGDRVISVSSQAIDAGPHQEVSPNLLGQAEKLVDVAFAIANMNAPRRVREQFSGLLQIVQPADTFFLFYRNPRRIEFLFESRSSFELLPRPELYSGQPQRDALRRQS